MNLACPIDNKDDSIQKVSAVVASGKSTGTFSGPTGGTVSYDGKSGSVSGYTTLSGSSTSSLAMLLAPPPEPAKPHGFGLWWILIWYPAIPMMGALLAMIVSFIITIPLWLIKTVFDIDIAIMVGLGSPFFMVVFFVGGWLGYRYFKGKENKKKAREEVKYLAEKPHWDNAIQKWNRLYYCHKHDVVFDPESGESSSPTSLKEFLFQSKSG